LSFTAADLVSILDLAPLADDLFRGRCPDVGWRRIFGGLVVSQALVATARSVTGREPHSLHGYFLRPGDPAAPIDYAVERLRDGRSFSTRRCVARQHGVPIFTLAASFQVAEDGLAHQAAMPDVPHPQALPSEADLLAHFRAVLPPGLRTYLERQRPVEMRPVDLTRYTATPQDAPRPPRQQIWMRAAGPLPDDPAIHRAVLAYLSDMTLLDVALAAHNRSVFDPALQVASLDHALWFHRPFRADAWLLYSQDSPSSSASRGLARGSFFTEDGVLVASVAQEGLLRPRGLREDVA
jgi:acyl-CoA thioesterase-2